MKLVLKEVPPEETHLLWKQLLSEVLENPLRLRLPVLKQALESAKGFPLKNGELNFGEHEHFLWVSENRGPYITLIDFIKSELRCDFNKAVAWVLEFIEDTPVEEKA